MDKYKKINITVGIIFGGTVLFLLYSYLGTRYLHLTWPYNDFLFIPKDRFMDFFNVNLLVSDLNPYGKDVSYPPFANFIDKKSINKSYN